MIDVLPKVLLKEYFSPAHVSLKFIKDHRSAQKDSGNPGKALFILHYWYREDWNKVKFIEDASVSLVTNSLK